MNQKAIIITHPHIYFDVDRSIEPNLESFVNEHQDYDVISLFDHGLYISKIFNETYGPKSHIIWSQNGEINPDEISKITSQYRTIVTAGGFFGQCALMTFEDLVDYKLRNSEQDLRIIIPLDLHYNYLVEEFIRKTITMQKFYTLQKENPENLKKIFDLHIFSLNLKESHRISLTQTKNSKLKIELQDRKILMEYLGLRIEGAVSYKEIQDL